jgi:acyl-CoA dehydrogenase
MSDTHTVRAFLEAKHHPWGAFVAAFAARELRGRPHAADDASARLEARELLRLMSEAGLYEPIRVRDLRACCLARELIAAASPLADAVWALQGLGTTPLLLAGTDEQRARWAEPALAGDVMTAFAITERGAGSDVAALSTRATRDGDTYVLEGHKWFISNAGIADVYVVFASTNPEAGSRGITAFVVPADAEGLTYAGPQVMSAPHPLGELRFEGCRIPAENRLGEEGRGFKIAMMTLDQLRPTVGAAACGMAERALREALSHAVDRTQFGQPLSDFQLIQEKLGRMAMELTAARMLVYRAAYEKDLGAERITTEAAMAKAFATEAAQRIVDDAVQILGGRGVMADHPVDLLYRSVRGLRIYEGTTEIQHLIIAATLVAEASARRSSAPPDSADGRGAGA